MPLTVPRTVPAPEDGAGHRRLRPSPLQIGLWVLTISYAVSWYVRHWGTFQLGVWTDDASYAVLARSLIHGPHYGLINVPQGAAPTRYPCGLPLLLVPFTLAFPHSLTALTLLSLLSVLGSAALLFWGWPGFSRRDSYWWGLAVSTLFLLTPLTLGETAMVMSEPEFTLASLGALWLTGRLKRGQGGAGTILAWSATLLLTVLIRTVGAAMVLTAFACLLSNRSRAAVKTVGLGLAGMTLLTGLLLVVTDVRPGNLLPGEYVHQLNDPSAFGQQQVTGPLGVRLVDGFRDYAMVELRQTVLPLGGGQKEAALWRRLHLPDISAALGLIMTSLIALGLWRGLARDGLSSLWLYALLSFAILLVWPWRGPRFLFPIQPQIFFAWLLGLEGLLSGLTTVLRAREPARFTAFAVVAILSALILVLIWHGHGVDDTRRHTGDFVLFNAWPRAHTPPSAVILCSEPQTDYLYADRKTLPFTDVLTKSDLVRLVTSHAVEDILIAPDLNWQAQFTPQYGAQTREIQNWLRDPDLRSHVTLAYNSPHDGVWVYHVLP